MNKKTKLILSIVVCFLCVGAIYLFANISQNNPVQTEVSENVTLPQKVEEQKYTDILDMSKWHYQADDNVYYQTGIIYAKSPIDTTQQRMALFVPEKYLRCDISENDTYTCVPNMAAIINGYTVRTAPIVTQINSPNYSGEAALTEYRSFKDFTDAGLVYAHISFRGIEQGAPFGVTDLKAAIRYIKHNSEIIPGNTESIFILGLNQGGLLAAILGASGDDRMYTPYLQAIGALNGINDSIKGVMLINPVSGIDTANEAVEWFFSSTRQGLPDNKKKLAAKIAKEYADYINRAGFTDPNGRILTLQYSGKGIYQEGTYYDYIKHLIEVSLQKFMTENQFPYLVPKSWEISEETAASQNNIQLSGTYQTQTKFLNALNAKNNWIEDLGLNGVSISSIADFNKIFKRNQPLLAAFDSFNKKSNENILYGLDGKQGLHFDAYTAKTLKNTNIGKEFNADLYKQDQFGYITLKRVNMYNPLYYLLSSYEGYKTSTVAPYWQINTGLFQNSIPLTSSVNLFLAVQNNPAVKEAEYRLIWGMGDITEIRKKDKNDFIKWIQGLK